MSLAIVLNPAETTQTRGMALKALWKTESPALSPLERINWVTRVVGQVCEATLGVSPGTRNGDVLFGILEWLEAENLKTVIYRGVMDYLDFAHPVARASRLKNTPELWEKQRASWRPEGHSGFDWAFWANLNREQDTFRGESGLVAFVEKNRTLAGWPEDAMSPFVPLERLFEENKWGFPGWMPDRAHPLGHTARRCVARTMELMTLLGADEALVHEQVRQTPARAFAGYARMQERPVKGGDPALRAQVWLWTLAHLAVFSSRRWPEALEMLDSMLPLTSEVGGLVQDWMDKDELGRLTGPDVLDAHGKLLKNALGEEQLAVWRMFSEATVARHQLQEKLEQAALVLPVAPVQRRRL